MSQKPIKSYDDEKQWYHSTEGVERLSTWYTTKKEVAFISFLLSHMALPPEGQVIELGGGAGLQGLEWKKRLGDRYLHTDYEPMMVERAKELGLRSEEVDGLDTPFKDNSVSGLVLLGTSTIIWDVGMRVRQFQEAYRVLSPGGVAVFVSSRLAGLRYGFKMKREDAETLRKIGFEIVLFRDWGIIPGSRWTAQNYDLFASIEGLMSRIGIGIRRTLIVRKPD